MENLHRSYEEFVNFYHARYGIAFPVPVISAMANFTTTTHRANAAAICSSKKYQLTIALH